MKKHLKSLLAFALVLAISLSMMACSAENPNKLDNFQPSADNEAYDTDLLYKNLSQFWGGDSGVIYVTEEESAEYGGYFYQYMSGCAGVYNGTLVYDAVGADENGNATSDESQIDHYGFVTCSRSKDLNDWELCGAVDYGFCLKSMPDEWILSSVWAPEVIYDAKTEMYYMYFSAKSKINTGDDPEVHYSNDNSGNFSRFYLGIASSKTPVGPFTLVSSLEYYGENGTRNADGQVVNRNGDVINGKNPAIDVGYYFKNNPNSIYRDQLADVEYPIWSVIDASPFFDENGDLYLYFSSHGSYMGNISQNTIKMSTDPTDPDYDGSQGTHEVWGFKMKDMITPDYESLRVVVPSVQSYSNAGQFDNFNCYVRVEYKGEMEGNELIDYPPYELGSYQRYLSWDDDDPEEKWNVPTNASDYNNDGAVIEAPQMITTKDKDGRTVYIMTYAPLGVGAASYDLKWCYSYDPLKGFIKPKGREMATILGVDTNNNFMTNLGHDAIVKAGDETWISHWEYPEAFSSWDTGRIHACTKMTWVENVEGYDFPIPAGNGPTKSCQAKPQVSTGYKNIAALATISAGKGSADTVGYLNDGLVVTSLKYENRQFSGKGKTTITLEFDRLQTIRGLLIHNSYDFQYAFKDIVNVVFTLEDGSEIVIDRIGLDSNYVVEPTTEAGWIEPGLAAVATFNEIKVSKISFNVENFYNSEEEFKISEIEILGK